MNIEKINDFIGAYSRALELSPEYTNILKELLPKLIQKYSQQVPSITDKQDDYDKYIIKPVNGKYSIEDFFLNRLMRNVLMVEIDNIAGDNQKGGFYDETHLIRFNPSVISRQLDGKLPANTPDLDDIKQTASKKVMMHEFEHALQSQFKRGGYIYPVGKGNYKKVIDEILKIGNGKYKGIIQTFEEIEQRPSSNSIGKLIKHNGLISTSYSKDIIDSTNEIFNETESLEMAGSKIQRYKTYPDGTYFPIRNTESSNRNITNYGDLIKILVGEKNAFIGMYIEPEKMFETFNSRYGDIFKETFGNEKTAWTNLMEQINKIKNTNAQEDHLMLQTILAKCLDKKIDHTIQSGKITPESLPKIKSAVMTFKNSMIWSKDKSVRDGLEHVQIMKSIRGRVEQLEQGLSLQSKTEPTIEDEVIIDSESKSTEPVLDEQSSSSIEDERKKKFINNFIRAYDDTETEYQYETRVNDESFNIQRVQDIIETNGLNRMLTMDLDGKLIGIPQDEDFKVQYSQKQVSAMVRLLKAAQLLTDNKNLNPTGRNYLEEFSSIPDIEYKLKQMQKDLKDSDSYMFELKETAKTNRANGTLPNFPETPGELEASDSSSTRSTSGQGLKQEMGISAEQAKKIEQAKDDAKRKEDEAKRKTDEEEISKSNEESAKQQKKLNAETVKRDIFNSKVTSKEAARSQEEIAERKLRSSLSFRATIGTLSQEEQQRLAMLNAKYGEPGNSKTQSTAQRKGNGMGR